MLFFKSKKEKELISLLEAQDKKIAKMEKFETAHQEMLNNIFIYHKLKPAPFTEISRKLSYELVMFMKNVCSKYDLDWWLDYGTLLGAVRHENFVPWDDDLDSGMMRADLEVLKSVLPDEIEANNLKYVKTHIKLDKHTDLKTKRWFQLKYNHPDFKGSFSVLDVFPYDYIKDYDEDTGDKFNKLLWNYYTFSKDDDMTPYMEKYFTEMNITLEKEDCLIPGIEGVRGSGGYASIYPFKIIKYDEIFPLKSMKFGDYEFPVPNQTRKYITDIYGENYFRIPNKVREHGVYQKNIKQDNILSAINEGIEALKTANSKY